MSIILEDFDKVLKTHHLSKIKEFYYNYKKYINLEYQYYCYFRFACSEGNLELSEWILSILSIDDVHHKYLHDELFKFGCIMAFHGACNNGHLHIAQWLYSIAPVKNDIDIC